MLSSFTVIPFVRPMSPTPGPPAVLTDGAPGPPGAGVGGRSASPRPGSQGRDNAGGGKGGLAPGPRCPAQPPGQRRAPTIPRPFIARPRIALCGWDLASPRLWGTGTAGSRRRGAAPAGWWRGVVGAEAQARSPGANDGTMHVEGKAGLRLAPAARPNRPASAAPLRY